MFEKKRTELLIYPDGLKPVPPPSIGSLISEFSSLKVDETKIRDIVVGYSATQGDTLHCFKPLSEFYYSTRENRMQSITNATSEIAISELVEDMDAQHEIRQIRCFTCGHYGNTTHAMFHRGRCEDCFECPKCGNRAELTHNIPENNQKESLDYYFLQCFFCMWRSNAAEAIENRIIAPSIEKLKERIQMLEHRESEQNFVDLVNIYSAHFTKIMKDLTFDNANTRMKHKMILEMRRERPFPSLQIGELTVEELNNHLSELNETLSSPFIDENNSISVDRLLSTTDVRFERRISNAWDYGEIGSFNEHLRQLCDGSSEIQKPIRKRLFCERNKRFMSSPLVLRGDGPEGDFRHRRIAVGLLPTMTIYRIMPIANAHYFNMKQPIPSHRDSIGAYLTEGLHSEVDIKINNPLKIPVKLKMQIVLQYNVMAAFAKENSVSDENSVQEPVSIILLDGGLKYEDLMFENGEEDLEDEHIRNVFDDTQFVVKRRANIVIIRLKARAKKGHVVCEEFHEATKNGIKKDRALVVLRCHLTEFDLPEHEETIVTEQPHSYTESLPFYVQLQFGLCR